MAAPASAAFSQATCTFGPNIPVDLGAGDLNGEPNMPDRYAISEKHSWDLIVNTNVTHLWFSYDFNSELTWDYLDIGYQGGTHRLTGNLGVGSLFGLPVIDVALRHFSILWNSDEIQSKVGRPKLTLAAPNCRATPTQPYQQGPLSVNMRYDGLFIASPDAIYLHTVQPAQTRLLITVDAVAADRQDADFDLYASANQALPDNSSYGWKDDGTNTTGTLDGAGAAIVVPPSATQRTIYFGVRSFRGAGHFIVRANAAKSLMTPVLTVCTPGVNMSTKQTSHPRVFETLEKTLMRMTQVTHGNYQPTGLVYKQISGSADLYCSVDSSCHICMTTPTSVPGQFCGFQSLGAVTRVPYYTCNDYNDPAWLSQILAHELGHSRFGLQDEYHPWGVANNHYCGHSIMNGPNGQSDRFCVDMNHCQGIGSGSTGPDGDDDCTATGDNWSRARAYGPLSTGWATTGFNGRNTTSASSSQPWKLYFRNNRARATMTRSFQ